MKKALAAAFDVVEASYRLDGTALEWIEGVLEASRSSLDGGWGLIGVSFTSTRQNRVRFIHEPVGVGDLLEGTHAGFPLISEGLSAEHAGETWLHPFSLDTARAAFERSYPGERFEEFEVFDPFREVGMVDMMVAKMLDADGTGCLLGAPLVEQHECSAHDRSIWQMVMTHVLAGRRLRSSLERAEHDDGDAVLDPGGRVVHAEGAAKHGTARDALQRAALGIDRARVKATTEPAEALHAWQGLVSGRWSLVDRFDRDGRRFLIARRNVPSVVGMQRLTARERLVASHVTRGRTNKEVAYALGLSTSTVSGHLRGAMRKLGVRTLADLARLFVLDEDGDGAPAD